MALEAEIQVALRVVDAMQIGAAEGIVNRALLRGVGFSEAQANRIVGGQ